MRFRYSRWDGSQNVPDLDADDLLDDLADELLTHGDVAHALRRTMQPRLQELLQRLRQRRQERMERYHLGSAFEDIKKKLDEIVAQERRGVEQLQGAERQRQQERFDAIPPDAAGRLKTLQQYDFVDPDAKRMFDELMQSLREQMLRPFMQGMQQSLERMTPEDLRRLREMIQDLNQLLRQRASGAEPDFEAFKQKWGQHFPGAGSLDDVIDQLGRNAAAMQSLLRSLSAAQREQLDAMMRSLFMQDERLEAALSQLGMHLAELLPLDEMARRYPFRGDEDVSLREAMALMDEMQRLDALEREIRGARDVADLDRIEPEEVAALAGEEAAQDLRRLQELARRLEEAGYLEREGDELTLTARAIRKIADKALRDIFARLTRDRFGGHALTRRGVGGDMTDESKPYEFGDPFLLDLRATVMNAVARGGPGTPVRLAPDDFAVVRTEQRTQAATVVMLDMSRSMLNSGYFLPAKKVALALSALIRGQFPRDALYVVGFSLYAREFRVQQLPTLAWTEWNVGTNMHAGFMLSRRLLGRHAGGNRQIIMVTDGEPTAHMEGDVPDFAYPPTRRTMDQTLREVRRCTREGITINTFMLERTPWLAQFVEQLTRINRGRAFFAAPDRLGEYVVVDYVNRRRAG